MCDLLRRVDGWAFRCAVGCALTAAAILLAGAIAGGGANVVHASVEINAGTFPDDNFRAFISGGEFDRDGNGVLDDNEIALTTYINCIGMGIQSLQGIEYFTELHGVWCSNNPLTSLDFTPNSKLEWVYCYDCNLTYLNVSNNPAMSYLEVNTNPLTSLDVSHNPLLEHLTCGSCELTQLDLSNNPNLSHLDAFGNHLTSLDVSHNPKMKRLDIWNNPGLGSINVSNNPGLQYYNCAYNGVTSVDVSKNTKLQKLICSYNQITNLNLSNNPELVYLDCACNQIRALDVSNNSKLYFLQAFTNNFTSLGIGDNVPLVKVYKDGVKKNESAVGQCHSWTIDYGGDTSTGGDNILFLCVDDKVTVNTTPTKKTQDRPNGSKEAPKDTRDLLTREMVVQTLYDMAGKPSVEGLKSRFTDAESGEWYTDALLWGEKNAVCLGYPDFSADTFGVGEWISRQDMTFMLMRYAEFKKYKRAIDFGRTDEFADYYEIDYYAWEAVTWAVTWNITNVKGNVNGPKSEQKLDPQGYATRADFEYMIKQMLAVNGQSIGAIPIPDQSVLEQSDDGRKDGEDDKKTESVNGKEPGKDVGTDGKEGGNGQAPADGAPGSGEVLTGTEDPAGDRTPSKPSGTKIDRNGILAGSLLFVIPVIFVVVFSFLSFRKAKTP